MYACARHRLRLPPCQPLFGRQRAAMRNAMESRAPPKRDSAAMSVTFVGVIFSTTVSAQ